MIEVYVSLFLLSTIVLLCLLGLYHKSFKDNWGQTIGMVILGPSCVFAGISIWQAQWHEPISFLILAGLWSFACGTAYKVWKHRNDAEAPASSARVFHAKQRG